MEITIKRIAVLLTCYNRREKTLNCLSNLYGQILLDGYDLDIYLVDDGSSDGTEEAVKKQFSKVNIIQGTGDLFWGGGMLLAWQTAVNNYEYDFYLWINDDTFLYSDALNIMISDSEQKQHQAIICGTTVSAQNGKLTYGGRIIGNSRLLQPDKKLKKCHIINGNFVLVPRYVYQKVGFLDPIYRHGIGDHDYSLRAIKNNIKVFIASKIIGECERNSAIPQWLSADVGLRKRIKHLYSPLGLNIRYFFIYEVRHFSIFQALKHFISAHIKLLFPRSDQND